jgi:glycosyltransferase involved in cell wall biosynthesis
MQQHFDASFIGSQSKVVRIITNGFNEPVDLKPASLTTSAINILYAGSFYAQRRLSVLIDALKQLKAHPNFENSRFAVHVFGSLHPADRRKIYQTELQHLVQEHVQVDHKSLLNFMKRADILYLPSDSGLTYALPFKVFDYLSIRRPILAVSSPESAVARLIAELDCGEVAEDKAAFVADAIERILLRKHQYRFAGRDKYTWTSIAGRYSRLMEELLEKRE